MGKNIIITGGTGMVGSALTKLLLLHDYQVTILTRNPNKANAFGNQVTYSKWDVDQQTIEVAAIQEADYIIHLAGAGVVDKPWTEAYKKEIINSRVESAKLIVKTLQNNTNQVKAVIGSSAIGWYGADTPSTLQNGFTEDATADKSFLGETCRLWEESLAPVEAMGVRHVSIRTGIVLGNGKGALAEFEKPIRLGVAGILANGKQMVSWIHIDDLCRIYLSAIENENLKGSYNAVAPTPVSNQQLTITLAKVMKNNWFIPIHVPPFVLKIMMGDRSIEVLKSCNVSSKKIQETGFKFNFSAIMPALENLLHKK